jgi:hypothetical protein
MEFKIIDKNDNDVTLNQIDAIAATLWEQPIRELDYASPVDQKDLMSFPNWFDRVGFAIAMQPKGPVKWSSVVGYLTSSVLMMAVSGQLDLNEVLKTKVPYIELINHLNDFGYQAQSL